MKNNSSNEIIAKSDLKVREWYSRLSIQMKVTFYSTFIIGIFTHLYFLMHKFTNEDDIMGLTASVDYTGLGRWFADNIAGVRTEYKMPFVIGILCIVYLSFAAVVMIDTLKIKTIISCILVGAFIITFPTISYTLGYLVSADGGAFAILMSVLAVWITVKHNKGYFIGIIFLCLSIGTYYAYIGLAIGISLLVILKLILEKKEDIKYIIGLMSKLMMMGIGGIILYFIITKITLALNNLQLPSYKGLDSMGKISINMIPELLEKTYMNFIKFFKGNYIYISEWLSILIFMSIIITIIIMIILVWENKLYKNINAIIGITLCIVAFPLAVNIIDFIAPESGTYTMTLYPFVLIFIIPCIMFDIVEAKLSEVNIKLNSLCRVLIQIGIPIICLMIIFQFYLLNNLYYLKADIYYQRTYSIHNRVLSRIESIPEFSKGASIGIIGTLPNLNYPNGNEMFLPIYNDYGLGAQYIGISGNGNNAVYNSQEFAMFCDQFLGVPVKPITQEQYDMIELDENFSKMPIWPEEGCIDIIEGIIVVNMNYNLGITIEQKEGNKYQFSHKFYDTMPEGVEYAWYIYRDGEQIDTKWYSNEPYLEYELEKDCEYQVLMFVAKDNIAIGQKLSEKIVGE